MFGLLYLWRSSYLEKGLFEWMVLNSSHASCSLLSLLKIFKAHSSSAVSWLKDPLPPLLDLASGRLFCFFLTPCTVLFTVSQCPQAPSSGSLFGPGQIHTCKRSMLCLPAPSLEVYKSRLKTPAPSVLLEGTTLVVLPSTWLPGLGFPLRDGEGSAVTGSG